MTNDTLSALREVEYRAKLESMLSANRIRQRNDQADAYGEDELAMLADEIEEFIRNRP